MKQEEVIKQFPEDYPTLDTSNRDQLTALLFPGSLVAMRTVRRLLEEDDPTVAWYVIPVSPSLLTSGAPVLFHLNGVDI